MEDALPAFVLHSEAAISAPMNDPPPTVFSHLTKRGEPLFLSGKKFPASRCAFRWLHRLGKQTLAQRPEQCPTPPLEAGEGQTTIKTPSGHMGIIFGHAFRSRITTLPVSAGGETARSQ